MADVLLGDGQFCTPKVTPIQMIPFSPNPKRFPNRAKNATGDRARFLLPVAGDPGASESGYQYVPWIALVHEEGLGALLVA